MERRLGMNYTIINYSNEYKEKWDKFVMEDSMNGTFLQTRRFIEYHPQERFDDGSLIFLKDDSIVAIILACIVREKNGAVMYSHKGSTYGGFVVSQNIYSCEAIGQLVVEFEDWLQKHSIMRIVMKQTPDLFSRHSTELVDYFLYKENYVAYSELNFYLDLQKYGGNIEGQFSSSRRRNYRHSLKNNLLFRQLNKREEIADFYQVLCVNLENLGLKCIHTLNELVDFHSNRLINEVDFYGEYLGEKLIAGAMLFYFGNNIVHTQYLSSLPEYRKLNSMDFLIYNLVKVSLDRKKQYLTFGICTEDNGKYINFSLASFKEGFGADYSINRTYEKSFIPAQILTEESNDS